jgi:uncharacterized integral membrane protein
MRGAPIWMLVILIAVTIFALSNNATVTVKFAQWQLYNGSLALAIVGAGVVGALVTFLSWLPHRSRLGSRIRDLEQRVRATEGAPRPQPSGTSGGSAPGADDTRRFP